MTQAADLDVDAGAIRASGSCAFHWTGTSAACKWHHAPSRIPRLMVRYAVLHNPVWTLLFTLESRLMVAECGTVRK